MRRMLFFVFFISISTNAFAMNGWVENGSFTVIVWKNKQALSDGMELAGAGKPMLAVPLMSCIVEPKTRVMTTTGPGFPLPGLMAGTYDIIVLDGIRQGCRGTIPREYFKDR